MQRIGFRQAQSAGDVKLSALHTGQRTLWNRSSGSNACWLSSACSGQWRTSRDSRWWRDRVSAASERLRVCRSHEAVRGFRRWWAEATYGRSCHRKSSTLLFIWLVHRPTQSYCVQSVLLHIIQLNIHIVSCCHFTVNVCICMQQCISQCNLRPIFNSAAASIPTLWFSGLSFNENLLLVVELLHSRTTVIMIGCCYAWSPSNSVSAGLHSRGTAEEDGVCRSLCSLDARPLCVRAQQEGKYYIGSQAK